MSKHAARKGAQKMDPTEEYALEKPKLYPTDFARADHVRGKKRKRYEEERELAFKRINELCDTKKKKSVSTEVQKKAIEAWCVEYIDTNFPDIGEVAYAVPTFFVGKHEIQMVPETRSYQHKQESNVRAENAQAKVSRGLRLLNAKMEKNANTMKGKGKKTPTMFIIDNVLYENALIGLDDIQSRPEMRKKFPNLIVKNQRQSSTKGRKETDITIIHEIKGVIIVEVKSFGTHQDDCGGNVKLKVLKQLNQDEKEFSRLFPHHKGTPEVKVCKVFALPNLSKDQATKRCEISDKDDFHLLTKDNLFDDEMERAEAEYNVDKLQAWWNALPDHPISPETMKDIVARFIGTLSKPRDLNSQTERSHARTTADAICLAGNMFKTHGLNLSSDERDALTSSDYNRTHVKGPPGSGRTTMLILKAMNFMKQSIAEATSSPTNKRHVVVLDLYRGFKGRPIGIQITNAIGDAENGDYKKRVHHLPLNVNENNEPFSQLVENLFPGRGKKPAWENVLFIIDEMLPLSYWPDIFEAFKNEFKDSHVWCADGLVSHELDKASKFKLLKLEHIYRLPGSVQKVLYHADWDDKRKQQYCFGEKQVVEPMKTRASGKSTAATPSGEESGQSSPDPAPRLNVCTHGPTAVCIKHQQHDPTALLNCVQCAEELKDLLINKMKSVETSVVEEQAQAASSPAKSVGGQMEVDTDNEDQEMEVDKEGDSQGTVAEPSAFLPCSIVIVFGIPSNLYQGKDNVEINKEKYEHYVEKVNNSQFISTLRKAFPVQLFPRFTGQNQDPDCRDNWHNVLLSWVDIFQGLERDVVIFLPGETASDVSQRKIPEPGLTTTVVAAANTEKGMSSYYWRVEDIQRYTDWDKTSLMFAATRCTSQLIMLVP